MAPLEPSQRIGDFVHAGAEIRRRAHRGPELLVAIRGKGGHRVRKMRIRRDARNIERGPGRPWQLCRGSFDRTARVSDPHLVQQVGRERVLIVRGKRPRPRVLRSDGHAAGRNSPAAVRERRDRHRAILEVRKASKCLVTAGRELMIEAHISLILIGDFVGGPAVVVRRAGRRWQGVAFEQRERGGIHRAPRNRVTRKW